MSDSARRDPPSPFVREWIERAAARRTAGARALDLAAGTGRHSVELLRAGYRVFAVDLRHDAVASIRKRAGELLNSGGHGRLLLWAADMTRVPLPPSFFDIVVVTRYLHRDLFPALQGSLVPGGLLLYETFTEAQLALGSGPRSPDHLLRPGELRVRCGSLDLLFYEEVTSPEAVARLAARRPSSD